MDPRHPQQHPFSRSTASPYSHAPFQSSSNQAPFPQASHAPSAPPLYPPDHQRRPSDNQYYSQQSTYGRDGAPIPTAGHSRHQSASSIGHGTPVSRGMPPPSSPQQRHEREPPHAQHQQHPSHAFPPPPSRGPPPALSTPLSFPASRDLPSLSSIHRPGSSMSISSMLGGPSPASREPATPSSQYPVPPPAASAPPSSSFNAPTHASPQTSTVGPDYARFRRPQTPELQRPHEGQGPRDHRANSDPRAHSAGSPPRPVALNTPEGHRYSNSMPQAYQGRNPLGAPMQPVDERREHYPVRVPNPNSAVPPPRPSSQPTSFNGPQSRQLEHSRMGLEGGRPESTYGRPSYSDRDDLYRERARLEEETLRRDRDRLEQERSARDQARERLDRERLEREHLDRERLDRREQASYAAPPVSVHEGSPYGHPYQQQQAGQYNGPPDSRDSREIREGRDVRDPRDIREGRDVRDVRDPRDIRDSRDGRDVRDVRDPRDPRDPREPTSWMRPRQEDRAPEHGPPPSAQAPSGPGGYDYPRSGPQSHNSQSSYAPQESRFPPSSYGQPVPQPRTSGPSQYGSPIQDRQRPMLGDQQQQQPMFQDAAQPGSYRLHESPRQRAAEEQQHFQQRSYLGVQPEINRKGLTSPFPQAVQGAQGQINGPGGEPGIKSEFGKMFSGIGSGVGGIGTPSASSNGAQTPFSNPGQLRREDLDGLISQDTAIENGGHKLARTGSRGGKRRNRLKEEDSREGDDSSTGRRTPSGRGSKRPKNNHHPIGATHRQTINRPDMADQLSSPPQQNSTPFKPVGGPQVVPSPPSIENKIVVPHHHHINRHHHHHHHTGPHQHKPAPTPAPLAILKPKQVVRNQAVLDSVADKPRYHLGHGVYESRISAGVPPSIERHHNPDRGFASTPLPIPRFEEKENCTYTVRIPRIHLESKSREEITSRRALWGTDIYTDDSDVIAACIHSGWIRGEWPDDVDTSLLGLEVLSLETDQPDAANVNGNKKLSRKLGKIGDNEDLEVTEPPAKGPMHVLPDHDMHVTLLILPALERYASTVRWGIRSRDFKKNHDGLSYMILSIRWVSGTDAGQKSGGVARRLRMEVNPGREEEEEEEFFNGNIEDNVWKRDDGIRQSNIRNDGQRGPMELQTSAWSKKMLKAVPEPEPPIVEKKQEPGVEEEAEVKKAPEVN